MPEKIESDFAPPEAGRATDIRSARSIDQNMVWLVAGREIPSWYWRINK